MAINNSDVKLFESQRLTDEEDGGGRVTGNEVVDAAIPDVSWTPTTTRGVEEA